MGDNSKVNLPGPLSDLGHRIDVWRRTRPKLAPMPSNLWKDAARLAQLHGINPVAKTLRLNYHALKRHLQAARGLRATAPPAFVEVSLSPPVPTSGCLVELERPDGAKMKVRVSHHEELVVLTESFWRCQP